MKKLTSLIFFLAIGVNFMLAQNDFIQFVETEHDFGVRKEEEEKLEHSFTFKNISDAPIKLTYVKASCGCTTPSWTTEVIKPNQEGVVKASYGARGRPGKFNKTVTVRAAKVDPATMMVVDSNNTDTKILYIKGDVTPREQGFKDFYPMEDGNLRFSTNHLAFGNIKTNETQTKEFVVFNQGPKPITISEFKNDYKHISVGFPGVTVLNPNDSTRFSITYDATQVNDYDWTHVQLTMVTTDDTTSNTWYKGNPGEKKIYVSATVQEHFDEKHLANPPGIEFEKEVHDFGTITQGDKVSTTFVFKNTGKSDLKIHKKSQLWMYSYST
jgi:hypothetical protein